VGLVCGLGLYLFKELAVDPVRQLVTGDRPTFTSLFAFRPGSLELGMAVAATTLVFVEESIYRGYALPFFEDRWGTLAAVIVTSAAFGLLHWGNGLEAIVITPFLGALLAGIFVWRRNLVAGTVAHALYNLAVLLT
jgi:membrane protease YdiL (CAAX protease family)